MPMVALTWRMLRLALVAAVTTLFFTPHNVLMNSMVLMEAVVAMALPQDGMYVTLSTKVE